MGQSGQQPRRRLRGRAVPSVHTGPGRHVTTPQWWVWRDRGDLGGPPTPCPCPVVPVPLPSGKAALPVAALDTAPCGIFASGNLGQLPGARGQFQGSSESVFELSLSWGPGRAQGGFARHPQGWTVSPPPTPAPCWCHRCRLIPWQVLEAGDREPEDRRLRSRRAGAPEGSPGLRAQSLAQAVAASARQPPCPLISPGHWWRAVSVCALS